MSVESNKLASCVRESHVTRCVTNGDTPTPSRSLATTTGPCEIPALILLSATSDCSLPTSPSSASTFARGLFWVVTHASDVSDHEMSKLRLHDEMVVRSALALNVSTDELLGLKNGQKDGAKPSLKIMRRMKALEGLPPIRQRIILDSLDLMIQSARNNGRSS